MSTNEILTGNPVTGTGGVTRAKLGTELPTDASTKLAEAFKALGYVGEDGVTRTVDATDDKIKAWGGDTVKVIRSDYAVTYTMVFLESANAELLKAIHGEENVSVTLPGPGQKGKVSIAHNSKIPPKASYTLEMKDGDTTLREVIPNGQIAMSGDVVFASSDVIRYEVTIEALVDAKGNNAYSYQDTPATDEAEAAA